MRAKVVKWLRTNSHIVLREGIFLIDLFSDRFDKAEWERYCRHIENPKGFGDIITLIGVAHLYKFNIFLVSSSLMRSQVFWTEIKPGYILKEGEKGPEETLMISCISEIRYGLIKNV